MAFDKLPPRWSNAGTEPPEGLKTDGWAPKQKPPADYFNWLHNKTYESIQELQQKAAEKTALDAVDAELDVVQDNLSAAPSTPITINQGVSVVTAERKSRFKSLTFKGRTLFNIPGRDGGFETLTGWTPAGMTPELSTTYKRSGLSSLKVAPTVSAGSYVYRDYTYKLETSKQYLALAWVYIESYTDGELEVSIRDLGTFDVRYKVITNTAQIGSWQLLKIKIPASNTITTDGFRLLVGAGSTGTLTAYFDEVSIYEITAAEYTAIDTMTAEQIAARWPYVDSAQHVNAVYVRNPG
ncbi:MAG: hypothetical protein K0Q94_543, partial [Paenibacillus sp.]|nr:hypothetical protein [Paenibacillus sp.]